MKKSFCSIDNLNEVPLIAAKVLIAVHKALNKEFVCANRIYIQTSDIQTVESLPIQSAQFFVSVFGQDYTVELHWNFERLEGGLKFLSNHLSKVGKDNVLYEMFFNFSYSFENFSIEQFCNEVEEIFCH